MFLFWLGTCRGQEADLAVHGLKGEYCGFLWDTTAGIELKDASSQENVQTNGNGRHSYPHPYIAHFKVTQFCQLTLAEMAVYSLGNLTSLAML